MVNTNDDLSESKSIAKSKDDLDFIKKTDFSPTVFIIDTKQEYFQKKKEKQASQMNISKYVKLSNKIFDYIYVTRYWRLFSLSSYHNLTFP